MEATRRKALGKGLGALIPGATRRSDASGELAAFSGSQEIQTASIFQNPLQPRQEFQSDSIEELSRSIKQNGVLQPIVVRRTDNGFELIAGERRWRAAQLAGLQRVPAIVKTANDQEALEIALVENLQREDLNPLDEAAAYRRLIDEFGLTQEVVAERVAKSRPAVANSLRLLSLPAEVQAEIRAGRLSGGHARAIAGGATPNLQIRAAREVVRRKLNVRDTEKLVRELSRGRDANIADLEDRLRRALGTKVRLRARANGSGTIEIDYFSLDELDGLIQRLTSS